MAYIIATSDETRNGELFDEPIRFFLMAEDDIFQDGGGDAECRDHFPIQFDTFRCDLNRLAVNALANNHTF